jgi:hypothetical protein
MSFAIRRSARRVLTMAMVGGLALGSAAYADTIYNDLDASIDGLHESMNLIAGGATGQTILSIQVDDQPDHPGCNLNNDNRFVQLAAASSDEAVATVAFLDGDDTFNGDQDCSETLTVVVTPHAAGTAEMTFSVADDFVPGNAVFALDTARFNVTVTGDGSGGGGGEVCDADPAAPAWANAILKANGVKNKTAVKNTISSVAQHMTQGAAFSGYAKSDHPDYENAVWEYMKGLGLNLPVGPSGAQHPGSECTEVPSL